MTILYIVIFLGLSWWLYKFTLKEYVVVKLPGDRSSALEVTGFEALVIAMFATCWIGLAPVLSIRLGFLELLCLIGLIKSRNYLPFSFPLKMYLFFLLWLVIGLTYTPSLEYGVRMILKYIYPFLFAMLCAKVVRNYNIFEYAGSWYRIVGTIGLIFIMTSIFPFMRGVLWLNAGYTTGLITVIILCFALFYHSSKKMTNLIWGLLLCLPCVILVFRTDIFGTAIAISMFLFLKYKIKSLPFIFGIGLLGLVVMFYVPHVKEKMFWRPDDVTIEDYLSGNIQEDQVRDNMRKFMWTDAINMYYKGHETVGSGTGSIQHFFYEIATDSRRKGQLHNDFLVLRCDNGDIGLALFIIAYLFIYFHCIKIYTTSDNTYIRLCSMVAGASILGVFVTMYSDNSLSYSMVTLGPPWGFYGMALGLSQKEKEEELIS